MGQRNECGDICSSVRLRLLGLCLNSSSACTSATVDFHHSFGYTSSGSRAAENAKAENVAVLARTSDMTAQIGTLTHETE
jgi:hypothetical protein